MNFDLHLHFRVSYEYEDFADAGYDQVAYYDEEDQLIVVREPNLNEVVSLWEEKSGGWDGEMIGADME